LLRRRGVIQILVMRLHAAAHGLQVFAPLSVGEMPSGSLCEERRRKKTEPECKNAHEKEYALERERFRYQRET